MGKKAKKRTVMESLFIDELSGVDRPAQEGAQALLIKRVSDDDLLKSAGLMLTSDEKGHSHLLDSNEEGGTTSCNSSSGAEYCHSHPWVKTSDGTMMIGAAEGHGHSVIEKRFIPEDDGLNFTVEKRLELAKEGKALPDGSFPIVDIADLRNADKAFSRAKNEGLVKRHIERRAKDLGALDALISIKSGLQKEKKAMTDKTEKTVEQVEKELQDKEVELAISKAFGDLNDAEKAYHAGLDSEGQKAFLKLDADGRKNLIEKAAGENPVVYTDAGGNEYRKSDDARVVAAVKRADESDKVAKEEREKNRDLEFAKRAEADLDKLPGDMDVKKALIKVVDGIDDTKIREGVTALLKAGNASLDKAFEKVGARGEGEKGTIDAEYEKLAEKYAKDNDVTIEIARADVLTKSAEGRELAKKMDEEYRS